MIPIKRNMSEEELKEYRREEYELEKENMTEFYKQMGYPQEGLNTFLINSLSRYKEELKEDGLI